MTASSPSSLSSPLPSPLALESHSAEATERIGAELAQFLRPGDVITLDGDLGAGKTAFTRGLARGLGLSSPIASPTFTIVSEHLAEQEDRLSLYHFDVYRLSDADDFLDSGLDEYLYRDGVSVLEWGEIVADALPEDVIRITLQGIGDIRTIRLAVPEEKRPILSRLRGALMGIPDVRIL